MKQEERSQKSRAHILEYAFAEFAQQGYLGASVNTICAAGKISKGLLYHYYADKDTLYLACVELCFQELTSALAAVLNAETVTPDQYFDARLAFFSQHPQHQRLFCDTVVNPPKHLLRELTACRALRPSTFRKLRTHSANAYSKILGSVVMSKVKNEPKYKNGLLQAIRAQLEHRAFWLYLLCDEAAKRGLDPRDFGSAAVKRCGLSQGADLVRKGNTDSLKGLRKVLFNKPAQLVFEMDILKSTDDALDIDFHYCPLVKAWQKAGCSDEEIAMLCDIAMCGDHGIGECYGSVLDLPKCIAKGDDVCSLRYHKKTL